MGNYHFGLIGYPLTHSFSLALHQAAFDALGLMGEYRLYAVQPEAGYLEIINNLLRQMQLGNIQGLNVTIPYKQTIIPLLNRLTPLAQAIGAINTIYLEGDDLIGDNTDSQGFLADLNLMIEQTSIKHSNSNPEAIVLGAGGSARAVIYALIQNGWDVCIAARNVEKAQVLSDTLTHNKTGKIDDKSEKNHFLHRKITVIPLQPSSLMHHPKPALIVNTTPVGMFPNINECPWPEEIDLPKGALIYDLVYNPAVTSLVSKARFRGNPASTGIGMLVEQAALSFERWTGFPAPRKAMRETIIH